MNYFVKSFKYQLIKKKIKHNNPFLYDENVSDRPRIFIFFCACGTNMGDHAIVKAEKKYILNHMKRGAEIIEISVSQTESAIEVLKNKIRDNDIIIFSGGGYIGDEYIEIYSPIKKLLRVFKNHTIVIFPQTIFFKNTNREKEFIRICKKCTDLSIFVREEISRKIFEKYGITTNLVPDIVFTEENITHKSNGSILLCMRNDVEKSLNDSIIKEIKACLNNLNKEIVITDTVIETIFDLKYRNDKLKEMYDSFANSSLVVTDRIHGMIFSYITNTPCIAFSNYNHKVKSEYEWIINCNYIEFLDVFESSKFEKMAEELINLEDKKQVMLENKFNSLKNVLERKL